MLRKLIAFQIFIYAIGFACAAIAALRWPSIMMLAGLIFGDKMPEGLEAVDWRLLGILNGAAWLLAALCFYASAQTLSGRRKGSLTWYCLALAASVPCLLLHSWPERWWQNLPPLEGALIGGAIGAALLFFAVAALSREPESAIPETAEAAEAEIQRLEAELVSAALQPAPEPVIETPRPKKRRPVKPGPAILRQRACFARYGRNWPKPRRVRLRWA